MPSSVAISDSAGLRPEFVLQLAQCGFDFFLAFARAAGHPVVLAQLIEHGATNALSGKGFELHALRGFIAGESIG